VVPGRGRVSARPFVRFGSLGDIEALMEHVRFAPESRHPQLRVLGQLCADFVDLVGLARQWRA
jgi:hypothetical protein